MSRDATLMKELNELRTLVESHQDEIRVLSEARQAVQGAFEELRSENERLRRELERAHAPDPLPAEPSYKPARNLVNVPR
jgi:chromosome segregation ATPase